MLHVPPLVSTIAIGLVLAFAFGVLANRCKLPPLVGYLVAGILIGPFTPGYVADQNIAAQLAEIGVILLMFGVGLHFSLKDLLAVRSIAIPGAPLQMGGATLVGVGEEHGVMETRRGRIAVGWLVVQDLAMVVALLLLPSLAKLLVLDGTE